jgi:hypothetical protein
MGIEYYTMRPGSAHHVTQDLLGKPDLRTQKAATQSRAYEVKDLEGLTSIQRCCSIILSELRMTMHKLRISKNVVSSNLFLMSSIAHRLVRRSTVEEPAKHETIISLLIGSFSEACSK